MEDEKKLAAGFGVAMPRKNLSGHYSLSGLRRIACGSSASLASTFCSISRAVCAIDSSWNCQDSLSPLLHPLPLLTGFLAGYLILYNYFSDFPEKLHILGQWLMLLHIVRVSRLNIIPPYFCTEPLHWEFRNIAYVSINHPVLMD